MTGPDGTAYPMDGEFHEVVEPEKIVFTSAALDRNGKRLFEVLNTITLTDLDGKTKLTLHAAVSGVTKEARPYLEGMNDGWNQSLDRLAALVTHGESRGDQPVILERTFNATVEQVWEALTNVEQMKQWYFPQLNDFRPDPGFTTEFNVHHEGKDWLHVWKIAEVVPLKKISLEWKFSGYPGNSLLTFELFPEGRQTKLVLTHEGIESFLPEQNPGLARENFVLGWTEFMDNGLKNFLER